jgi:hypothetical protein
MREIITSKELDKKYVEGFKTGKIFKTSKDFVGEIIRFQVADGYSYYKVVKISKKTATLEHVTSSDYDNYIEPVLGFKGTVPVSKLNEIIGQKYIILNLFGKQNKK